MPENHLISQFEINYTDDKKDIILIIRPQQKFSNCFVRALSVEFPDFNIRQSETCTSLGALSISDINLVNMIIVHEQLCSQSVNLEKTIRDLFPSQLLVLAYHNKPTSIQNLKAFDNLFDSHLPMDVRLDVWLAVIKLLLAGGKYISPELFSIGDPQDNTSPIIREQELKGSEINNYSDQPSADSLSKLTAREIDVLKLVAAGQQNKIIADKLGLSEHTIKLHLHHIISKLNVTNRTEATAIFLGAGSMGHSI